jgi:hypothetical protein
MLDLQSISLTLSVLALTLIVVWVMEKRGKQLNNIPVGVSLVTIGLAILVVGFIGSWLQQTLNLWNSFKNTGVAVFTAGIVLIIRIKVQNEPNKLRWLLIGPIVVAIVALGFFITSLVCLK